MSDPATPEQARPPGRTILPTLAFLVAIGSAIGLAVIYGLGGQNQAEGILLGATLGGIGAGMVLWGQRFMPQGPEVEDRGRIGSTEEEIEAFADDFSAGSETFERRGLLTKLLFGALAALGVAALFPIRSLGPNPGRGLKSTPYAPGVRLVGEDGEPIAAGEPNTDGIVTVFPEGSVGDENAQTILLRLPEGVNRPAPGREDWTPEDLIAYSKVCTHAGCPVGLYEEESNLLLCPCHQSTFDAAEHAKVRFGPADHDLPQLPLDIDDSGFIVARDDFSEPVGPGFWDRLK